MTLSKFLFVRPFSISGENGEMTHFFTVTFSSLIASHTLTLTYSRCEECVCVRVCKRELLGRFMQRGKGYNIRW